MIGRIEAKETKFRTWHTVARMIGFWVVAPWTKKLKRFEDLILFPWEESPDIPSEAVSEFMARRKRFMRHIERLRSIQPGQAKRVKPNERIKVLKANPNA